MASLIKSHRTGLFCCPNSPEDLAAQVTWVFGHPVEFALMRRHARQEFEARYIADRTYEQLLGIYHTARERTGRHAPGEYKAAALQ